MQAQVAEAEERHRSLCLSVHEQYPLLGIARAHHRNKRGEPITFADKPSLIPLYANLVEMPEANFTKAVQTGISELLIQLTLYNAGWRDRICAYVMPQSDSVQRFVDLRLNELLNTVPAYMARAPGKDFGSAAGSKGNLTRKRFGRRGSMLFLSAKTDSDFVEFSADMIIVDEYDKCVATKEGEANVAKVRDRIQESPCPQVFRVGNPDFSGKGTHKLWKDGTRGKWYQQCTNCNERQPLVWDEHFVRKTDDGRWVPRDTQRARDPALGDLRPVCRRCKRPWQRVPEGGLWINETEAGVPSFHMSRLDVLHSAANPQPIRGYYAEWVAAQQSSRLLEAFYTGRLGWAYEMAGSRVSVEMLERVMRDSLPLDYDGGDKYKNPTMIMGVDVGSVLNVSISELVADDSLIGEDGMGSGWRRRGTFVCAVREFSEVIELIDKYRVDACVIDAMPETRKAKEVRDHYINTGTCDVWLCRFHPTGKTGRDAFGLRMDYNSKEITVDRTQVFDQTLEDIANGVKTFPSDTSTVLGFIDQMRAPIRKFNQERNCIEWAEGNDPDHFRCADIYERVAQEIADRGGGFFET